MHYLVLAGFSRPYPEFSYSHLKSLLPQSILSSFFFPSVVAKFPVWALYLIHLIIWIFEVNDLFYQ